jgi:hypothetical protein
MSTPDVSKSNQSNLFGELRVAQGEISRAVASAPLSIRNLLVGAVSDVISALENVTQGQAEATRILADQRYAPAEQYRQASAVMSKAFAASAAANKALEAAAANARKQLEAALLPKAPRDVSEAAMLDRKADLTVLLAHTDGTPTDKAQTLAKQLRRALQTSDDLTAYVLTSKMSVVYQANGINTTALGEAFAQVLGEPIVDDDGDVAGADREPVRGAVLLASLQHGGPNTVAGVLVLAINLLYKAQREWDSWLGRVKAG